MIVLPFRPSIGAYTFRTLLVNVEYGFDVRWNPIEKAWYFNLSEANGNLIVRGVKVVLGTYLARRSTHTLFRDGAMVARVPHGDDRREPGFDDMGTRVEVWYFTRDEAIEEILASLLGRGTR